MSCRHWYCPIGFCGDCKGGENRCDRRLPCGLRKKTFEKYGIESSRYFVITELGIEKTHGFSKLQGETETVLKAIESSF